MLFIMNSETVAAVLTGDIVDSRSLAQSEQDQLSKEISDAAAFARLDDGFEVFRGDSWQAFCPNPRLAFAKALILRSYLLGAKSLETRVAIGIGTVERDRINPEKISLSQDEAFVLSGQALSEMPRDRRLALKAGPAIPDSIHQLLDASCTLLDALSSNWTAKQALAVALDTSIFPQTSKQSQADLAARFDPPISPQAYGKHLASAQWKLVKQSLQNIAQALDVTLP